jgi:hypothetical protein
MLRFPSARIEVCLGDMKSPLRPIVVAMQKAYIKGYKRAYDMPF